jgi:CRISPR type III-associated protein (TIGR04423 family)
MSEPLFQTRRLTLEELRVELDALRAAGVVGFVRFSDAETPVYVDSKSEPLPALPALPRFLYEAALYVEGRKSVSIRQFNDFWLWNEVEWNGLPPKEDGAAENGLAYTQMALGGRKLRFYTRFLPVQDACASFPTLRPAWNAFIGFEEGEC